MSTEQLADRPGDDGPRWLRVGPLRGGRFPPHPEWPPEPLTPIEVWLARLSYPMGTLMGGLFALAGSTTIPIVCAACALVLPLLIPAVRRRQLLGLPARS